MQVRFKMFRTGKFESRLRFYAKVAAFASQFGPDKLINIAHSDSNTGRVAVVWYWAEGADEVVTFELAPDQEEIVTFELDPDAVQPPGVELAEEAVAAKKKQLGF